MSESTSQRNKAFVLEAFEALFNKKDFVAAEKFWSSNYIQHSAHIPPGRDGLFALVKSAAPEMKYENSLIMAEGDMLMLHGRFSALVSPRTGSWSTLFASRTDCWRSTGTSLKTRSRGKSQPAAFQCSARRFPPDDSVPKGQPNERRQDPVARIPRRRHARPRRRRPVRRGRSSRTAVPAFAGHPLAPPGSPGDQRAPRLTHRALSGLRLQARGYPRPDRYP